MPGELVTVASLNTRGIPPHRAELAGRARIVNEKEPLGYVSDHIGLRASCP